LGARAARHQFRSGYIRFVALSEINGQPWASVAELDLVGVAQ